MGCGTRRVWGCETYVLIQVERSPSAAVQFATVRKGDESCVETRLGVAGGETEDNVILATLQRLQSLPDPVSRDVAHLLEIAGDQNLYGQR